MITAGRNLLRWGKSPAMRAFCPLDLRSPLPSPCAVAEAHAALLHDDHDYPDQGLGRRKARWILDGRDRISATSNERP